MLHRDRRARTGFTVAGILLSIAVFLMLSPFLIRSIGMAAERAIYFADREKAFSRIAAVEGFLKSPAFYCGLGIPLEPSDYQRAFGDENYMPYNWPGPISAGKAPFTISQNRLPEAALFIAYAKPGSTRLKLDTTLDETNEFLFFETAPEESEMKSASSSGYMETKNWITFSGGLPQKNPLKVRLILGNKVSVQSLSGNKILLQKNDRLLLFRALILVAENDILYSYDYRTSGKQPRIFGIRDIRFEVDVEKQKLTAYVLARGDRKYATLQEIIGREEWPARYHSDLLAKQGEYQLFAKKLVWRLPNCTKNNVLERGDVSVLF